MGDSQLWQRPLRHRRRGAGPGTVAGAIAVVLALLVSGVASAPALADTPCAKFAAEPARGGSDANPGDEAHPYATLGKLAASLSAGQTGCIFSGQTIDVDQPQSLRDETHGTEAAPITITSTNPAEPATVSNSLSLDEGSNWINLTHLRFWWAQPPPYTCWNAEGSPTGIACNGEPENPEDHVQIAISSSHTSWLYDDIQNFNTDICMNIVSYDGSVAEDTLIEHDRVHNCGLPFKGETPHVNEEGAWHDHGIYDYGIGTKIFNDYIYGNSRNGILFYGGGHGGVAEHNVIDDNGNGITFGSTIDSTARWNIITNNSLDDTGNCAPLGCDDFGVAVNEASGDRFEDNCLDNNLSGEIEGFLTEPASLLGVIVGDNLLHTDPLYTNAANHEYTLLPSSPCLGYGPDTAQPGPPPPAGTAPVNTLLPSILASMPGGPPVVGEAVIAVTGGWLGAPTGFSYQWNACSGAICTPIPEATAPAYIPTRANLEETLTVTVTATNANGSANATSAQTQPVIFTVQPVVGRPSGAMFGAIPTFVSGDASGGLVLTTVGFGGEGLLGTLLEAGAWTTSSAPSTAVGPAGALWIAFQGPNNSLWITGDVPSTGRALVSYRSPEGTTYSAPSIAIDSAGDIWVAAAGPDRELVVTQRPAGSVTWSSSSTTPTGAVFSSPSAAVDPSGSVWIAFQGIHHALFVETESPIGRWSISSAGASDTAYSEPSTAIDAAGNVWVSAEGPDNSLLVSERAAGAGVWRAPETLLAETVYSSPSTVVDSAGKVSIAFQGPRGSLKVAEASPDGGLATISFAGPEAMTASAPSAMAGPYGELWIGFQQPDSEPGVLERLASGVWTVLP